MNSTHFQFSIPLIWKLVKILFKEKIKKMNRNQFINETSLSLAEYNTQIHISLVLWLLCTHIFTYYMESSPKHTHRSVSMFIVFMRVWACGRVSGKTYVCDCQNEYMYTWLAVVLVRCMWKCSLFIFHVDLGLSNDFYSSLL